MGVSLTGSGSGVGVADDDVLEMRSFEGRGTIFLSGNVIVVGGEVRCFLTFESSIVLDFGSIFCISGLGCGECCEGLLMGWGKGAIPRP